MRYGFGPTFAVIGFKIKILGRRTRRALTTDNASKIFILKPIVKEKLSCKNIAKRRMSDDLSNRARCFGCCQRHGG